MLESVRIVIVIFTPLQDAEPRNKILILFLYME